MNMLCPKCLNNVPAWQQGVMTYQISQHHRADGAPCPGSGQIRSTAR